MQGKVTYHQQVSFCGKASCRKCREGVGHGPYWYAYQVVDGRTTRTYVGKQLPPEAQSAYDAQMASMTKGTPSIADITPSKPSLQAADDFVVRGALSNAIPILDHLLARDPTNGAAVQRLIVILAQLQRRGEALRTYQRFAETVQRVQGIAPSQELQALYEAVRRGEPVAYPMPAYAKEETVGILERAEDSVPAPSIDEAQEIAPMHIGRTHQNPLIGRERELQALRMLLLDTGRYVHPEADSRKRFQAIPLDTQRRPQCVLLMGEAGIGKTRLAEEVGREAMLSGWFVLWSRVYPQESGIPYRPWIELLRGVLSRIGDVATDGKLASPLRGSQSLPSYLQPLVALLPELQASLPMMERAVQAVALEQLRLREAVRDALITASARGPMMVVLDDIQWADASSCELLGYLARHLHGYPILLIGTCREYEITAPPLRSLVDHMQREHTIQTLHIEPLTKEQIALLVSHVPDLPEAVVQHIQSQAAGNPFFAEELARLMPPLSVRLPQTITAALDSRLHRLSSACQQLLGSAAVLGGSFEFSAICAMEASAAEARVDEDGLLDLLDEALQAGVLSEEGVGSRITYSFWHPLLVTHLYERISATRRTRLHRRAAEVLQRLSSNQAEVAAMITHHLIQGGADARQITHYAELAGHRAYGLLAYPEAEQYYRLAVNYRDAADYQDMSTLLERLAECTVIQGKFEEARRLYEQSLMMRTTAPAVDVRYQAQRQALLLGEIGRMWRYAGDIAQALACCEQGEAVLRAAGVLAGPAWARLRYQVSSFYESEGRYEEARQASQEALALFERPGQTNTIGSEKLSSSTLPTRIERTLMGDPVDLGRTYALLGTLDYRLGQFSEALAQLNIALAIYEQYDQKREIAHVSCNIGHLHLKRGEYEPAYAALRRSLSVAERIGDGPLTSVVFMNLGELEVCTGDLSKAEEWYRKSLALAERFHDQQYLSLWNTDLASILIRQGKLTEAATSIREALRIGRAMQNAPCIGAALVTLGRLRLAQATCVSHSDLRSRLLLHAKNDVQRALELERLEAETRAKGQEVLGQVAALLGNRPPSQEQAP